MYTTSKPAMNMDTTTNLQFTMLQDTIGYRRVYNPTKELKILMPSSML